MSSKPRVFVSSTIYDFTDLRSAIGYYLENLGFDVVMSDRNDFSGPIDSNSYDACLRAIESCDYFILLIGSRVGGWYQKGNRISITRQEYRIAYDRLKQGKTKILSFVRKPIWIVREDRKELAALLRNEYQSSHELSEDQIDAILHHKSTFMNDAKMILDFIDEVVHRKEMKEAGSAEKPFPPGNWIWPFDGFEDIVATLQAQLGARRPIAELAMRANLREEIVSNLKHMVITRKTGVLSGTEFLEFLNREKPDLEDLQGMTVIPADKAARLVIYVLSALPASEALSSTFAHSALESGLLHALNPDTAQVTLTKLGKRVMQLMEQLRQLRSISASIEGRRDAILKLRQQSKASGSDMLIPTFDAYMLLYAHNRQQDVMTLSRAIVRALDSSDDDSPTLDDLALNPLSPSPEMAEQMQKERPTQDHIENWINAG